MRLDPEKDKLDAKIQYLKEHLNSGKTANELEKEFEEQGDICHTSTTHNMK